MKCPYCGAEMESGRIEINAVLHIIHHPADIIFEPDEPFDKKKVSLAVAKRDGWYCKVCNKIFGIFDVSL